MNNRTFIGAALVAATILITFVPGVRAEEPNCVSCHEDLTTGTSVHAAVAMGCTTCHANVDATNVPHTFKGKNPKGLATKMRDLCYTCHDRSTFMKTTVHGAIALGCTTCHNPHSSPNARLLKEAVPSLCIGCHQDRFAQGKNSNHDLAGNEACSTCHNPHASDAPKLIVSKTPAGQVTQTALIKP